VPKQNGGYGSEKNKYMKMKSLLPNPNVEIGNLGKVPFWQQHLCCKSKK